MPGTAGKWCRSSAADIVERRVGDEAIEEVPHAAAGSAEESLVCDEAGSIDQAR